MKEFERWEAKGFLILLFYFLILIFVLIVEPNNLVVTENNFSLISGSDGTPLKIVFISDIHIGLQKAGWLDQVVDRVNEQEPDVILIGGDVIESDASELEKLEPLRRLHAPYGVYAVLGNHDYEWWGCAAGNATAGKVEQKLESMGIDMLRNEHEIINVRGKEFALIGLDELWACRNDYRAAAEGTDGIPKIILTHNRNAVKPEEIDGRAVILAGHTHCGLIRVPVLTELVLGTRPVGGRAALDNDTDAYITCGVTGGGIRFLTNPEISVITIK
ncbi:MAG: metallophosphoesterase [Candidatus Micrarchaeota archaeon]